MNKLILALIILLTTGCTSTSNTLGYCKVGAGYKFDEAYVYWGDGEKNHPVSARFECGVEDGALSYGGAHHSQWKTGAPFNDGYEYYKTEIFIDYKFTIWE